MVQTRSHCTTPPKCTSDQRYTRRERVHLPQTDRASAFCGRRVTIFLVPSLITGQNLVVVSHTVSAHLCLRNFGDAGAPPSYEGVTGPLEARSSQHLLSYHI